MIENKKKIISEIIFFVLIFFVLILILKTDTIYLINSLDKNIEIDNNYIFEDWKFIFNTIECKALGHDITKVNPCDELGRLWWGDNIQFYIPYFQNFDLFYLTILPWTQIIIFFYIIFKIFDIKENIVKVLIVFIVFSPQILLLISRMNNDLLIFILIFFIVLKNKNYLNTIVITYISLAKFYPLISSVIFFLNSEKLKKNFLYLFITLILFISFIFFTIDYNQIESFFEHRGQLYGKSLRNFSIIASAKYYSIIFSDIDFYKKFEVILSLILLFLIISAISYFLLSKSKKYHFDITNLNFRLFVVGANIIVITYIIFQNTFYREVYLILVIPFLLQYLKDSTFNRYLFYFIFIKYFLGFLFVILFPIIGIIPIIVLFKMILDFFIIAILSGLLIHINLIILREKLRLTKS